jgi:hypothetical protein
VSDETREMLERFTLAELVDRTRVGHPESTGGLADLATQPAVVAEN